MGGADILLNKAESLFNALGGKAIGLSVGLSGIPVGELDEEGGVSSADEWNVYGHKLSVPGSDHNGGSTMLRLSPTGSSVPHPYPCDGPGPWPNHQSRSQPSNQSTHSPSPTPPRLHKSGLRSRNGRESNAQSQSHTASTTENESSNSVARQAPGLRRLSLLHA